ncbi:MAG: hypothetical protein WBW33_18525 [Bryobacteraceae bacterium]
MDNNSPVWAIQCKTIDCPAKFVIPGTLQSVFPFEGSTLIEQCEYCGEVNTFREADVSEDVGQHSWWASFNPKYSPLNPVDLRQV